MRSSLVLNASYEPLSVVPARRAACLVLAEKAELVECDGLLIRSASLTLASPFVIRLRYMVKVPYRRKASLSRRGVFARDDYRCQYCGAHADSIDHVTPRRVAAGTSGRTSRPPAAPATWPSAIAPPTRPECV